MQDTHNEEQLRLREELEDLEHRLHIERLSGVCAICGDETIAVELEREIALREEHLDPTFEKKEG